MIRDEFNKVHITNEKQVERVEYGKTQKSEFSSQKENKLPDVELNDKVQAQSTSTSQASLDTTNLIQQNQTGITSVGAESSAGALTSTSSAVASASSIAATTSSVVAVASVVAVTAISVATGISIALHDYSFQFNSFVITSNSVTYDLSIFDSKTEDYDIEEYHRCGSDHRCAYNFQTAYFY